VDEWVKRLPKEQPGKSINKICLHRALQRRISV